MRAAGSESHLGADQAKAGPVRLALAIPPTTPSTPPAEAPFSASAGVYADALLLLAVAFSAGARLAAADMGRVDCGVVLLTSSQDGLSLVSD